MKEIDVFELEKELRSSKEVVLVDVRQPEEWDEGVVKEAFLVSLNDIPIYLNEWDKGKTYYMMCRSGARSQRACDILAAENFDVHNIRGGILAWSANGYPTIKEGINHE